MSKSGYSTDLIVTYQLSDKFLNYKKEHAKEILKLESLRFIKNNENILFVGSSKVGKTHLATAIGIAEAKKRYSTYFITCHDLIMQLRKAHNENRLEQRLKQFYIVIFHQFYKFINTFFKSIYYFV